MASQAQAHDRTVKLGPLINVGIVVNDGSAAARFLKSIFGTVSLDRGSSSLLRESGARLDGIGLGDAALQFIQPAGSKDAWSAQLSEFGPSVHTLAFYVDDLDAATTRLSEEGINELYRADFQRGDTSQPLRAMHTMADLGFNLELVQAPDPDKLEQLRSEEDDTLHGEVSPLFHVEMVVADLDRPHRLLNRVFGAERVEAPMSDFLEQVLDSGRLLKMRHIGLGDVVLQYCQPLTSKDIWQERISAGGASVINITWLVNDMRRIAMRLSEHGVQDLYAGVSDYQGLVGADNTIADMEEARIVDTRSLLGFNLELGVRFAKNMDHYIMNPFSAWVDRIESGRA